MADLSITAANVIAGSGATVKGGTAGATITAGQVVYLDSAAGTYKLADNDDAAADEPHGIALNGAAAGQPLAVLTEGPVTIGATLTAGTTYYLSDTAGGICPHGDLANPQTVTLLGIATSASVLQVGIVQTGVTIPE